MTDSPWARLLAQQQVALASGQSDRTLSVLWLTHSEAMPVAVQCAHAAAWQREMPWLVGGWLGVDVKVILTIPCM
jgi:hypothetical protein